MQLFQSLKEFIQHSSFPINLIDDVEQYFHDSPYENSADINNEYFLYAINNKQEIVKLSRGTKNIIGYSQEDLPLSVLDIFEPDTKDLKEVLEYKFLKKTPVNLFRFKIKHKNNGSIVYLDLMSLNSYGEEGNFISTVGVAHNITKHVYANNRLQETLLSTIQALSTALELRDKYTAGHMSSTAKLSVEIGKLFKFNKERLDALFLGATLHDIGKIALSLELLNKKGELSGGEFNTIKKHPIYGADIIKNIDFCAPIKLMVEQHHERIDGSGYPLGLKDEDIILEAKIIAVADSFDAMTTDRPYRKALSKEKTLKIINEEKGKKLCINVVSKLEELDRCGYLDTHVNAS